MKRRRAVQTIVLGIGGAAPFSHCTSPSSVFLNLKNEDKTLISIMSEIILPSKSRLFPTPETRLEFIVNQVDGVLSQEEIEKYQKGLSTIKRLIEETYSKEYDAIDFVTQETIVLRALGLPDEAGFFMRKNRQWSLRHFMTSERYMTEYFNYEFIPNRHLGCASV